MPEIYVDEAACNYDTTPYIVREHLAYLRPVKSREPDCISNQSCMNNVDNTNNGALGGALNQKNIKDLHYQLRHGTKTAMERYIQIAGLWSNQVENLVGHVFDQCDCRPAFPPKLHGKVGTELSSADVQSISGLMSCSAK